MSTQDLHEWPVITIPCIEEALRPYRHNVLTSLAPEVLRVCDTIRLFLDLCLTASLSGFGKTRATTHANAARWWQDICTSAIKQQADQWCRIRTNDLKKLRAIQVEDLWMLVLKNEARFGSPHVSCRSRTLRRWLVRCIATNVNNDSGNVIRESIERLELGHPVRHSPPSNSPSDYHPRGVAGMFPEMNNMLMQLRPDEPQFHDCIISTFKNFLRLAYIALDIYTYYRPHKTDPEPCRCKLDYMVEKYVEETQYSYNVTMRYPVYLTKLVMNINLRGTFDFLFTHVFPWLYRRHKTVHIGFRLYDWLVIAAVRQLIEDKNSVMHVLNPAYDPEDVSPSERIFFRPVDAFRRVHMSDLNWHRLNGAIQRNGNQPLDIPSIPYGPLIDVSCHTSTIRLSNEASSNELVEEKEYNNEGLICVICQNGSLDEGELLVKLNVCGHTYHKDCIGLWMNSRTMEVTCPMCREGVCEARPSRPGCEFCEQ